MTFFMIEELTWLAREGNREWIWSKPTRPNELLNRGENRPKLLDFRPENASVKFDKLFLFGADDDANLNCKS